MVGRLAVSQDGRTLAVSRMGGITLISLATHRIVASLPQSSSVSAMALSPDGHTLAADGTQALTLWDLPSHSEIAVLKGDGSSPAVAFSADDTTLLTANPSRVALVDISTHDAAIELCDRGVASLTPDQWAHDIPGVAFNPPCPHN